MAKKYSRMGLWWGIGVAIAVVIIGGGAALWYGLYQKPTTSITTGGEISVTYGVQDPGFDKTCAPQAGGTSYMPIDETYWKMVGGLKRIGCGSLNGNPFASIFWAAGDPSVGVKQEVVLGAPLTTAAIGTLTARVQYSQVGTIEIVYYGVNNNRISNSVMLLQKSFPQTPGTTGNWQTFSNKNWSAPVGTSKYTISAFISGADAASFQTQYPAITSSTNYATLMIDNLNFTFSGPAAATIPSVTATSTIPPSPTLTTAVPSVTYIQNGSFETGTGADTKPSLDGWTQNPAGSFTNPANGTSPSAGYYASTSSKSGSISQMIQNVTDNHLYRITAKLMRKSTDRDVAMCQFWSIPGGGGGPGPCVKLSYFTNSTGVVTATLDVVYSNPGSGQMWLSFNIQQGTGEVGIDDVTVSELPFAQANYQTISGNGWVAISNSQFLVEAGSMRPDGWNLTGGAYYASANLATCDSQPCIQFPNGNGTSMVSQNINLDASVFPNGLTIAKSATLLADLIYSRSGQIGIDYYTKDGKQAGASTFVYLKDELAPQMLGSNIHSFRTLTKTVTVPAGTARIVVSAANSSSKDTDAERSNSGYIYLKKLDFFFKGN